MSDQLYPALYDAADRASNKTQHTFVLITKAYLALVVLSVALGFILPKTSWAAIVTAVFLMITMLAPVFMMIMKYSDTWYRARALAESVKTSTWKFMMRSEPFNIPDGDAKAHFQDLLRRLLGEHRVLGEALGGEAKMRQVMPMMEKIRKAQLDVRKSFYIEKRVREQYEWYCKKARQNKRSARLWLVFMLAFHVIAVIFSLIQISMPERDLPIELFVVLGGSALSWMQFKKFGELGAAYALTAQEISIAGEGVVGVSFEEDFSTVVADIENAFSREHTQWVARKDKQ